MSGLARIGDESDHGGHIISGSSTLLVNGIGAARAGDMHECPIHGHGTTPITGAGPATNEGRQLATAGCVAGCGAVILGGSPNVLG